MCTLLGTWPVTKACALTGNRIGDPLSHRPTLSPLSHNSQGDSASSNGVYPKGGDVDRKVPMEWPLNSIVVGVRLYCSMDSSCPSNRRIPTCRGFLITFLFICKRDQVGSLCVVAGIPYQLPD